VKIDDYGEPIKRPRLKVTVAHVDTIGTAFWENHPHILREGWFEFIQLSFKLQINLRVCI
jgi:tRNA(His) guanylyltransferase